MIPERIKELRLQANISQSQLAKKMGISRASVNAWEMGISQPTIRYILDMADIFNVTPDYILCYSDKQALVLEGLNDKEIKIVTELVTYFKEGKNI